MKSRTQPAHTTTKDSPRRHRPLKQWTGHIIIDLDDTLLDSGTRYYRLIVQLAGRLSRLFSRRISAAAVTRLQECVDVEQVRVHGFTRRRFPTSFVETYRRLCIRFGKPFDPARARKYFDLGDRVYRVVPPMLPGARAALQKIRRMNYRMVLYTLGTRHVQMEKVRRHGLDRLFDSIHIVLRKDEHTLRRAAGRAAPSQVIVVGDSLRGEVAPALNLGFRAAHIRHANGWDYLRVPVKGDYIKMKSFREILKYI